MGGYGYGRSGDDAQIVHQVSAWTTKVRVQSRLTPVNTIQRFECMCRLSSLGDHPGLSASNRELLLHAYAMTEMNELPLLNTCFTRGGAEFLSAI